MSILMKMKDDGTMLLTSDDTMSRYILKSWQKDGSKIAVSHKGEAVGEAHTETPTDTTETATAAAATETTAKPKSKAVVELEDLRTKLKKLGAEFKKNHKIPALRVLLDNTLDSLGLKESDIDGYDLKAAKAAQAAEVEGATVEGEDDMFSLDDKETETPAETKAWTVEEIRAKMQSYANDNGVPAARAILKKFDVANVGSLKPAQYQDVVAAVGGA